MLIMMAVKSIYTVRHKNTPKIYRS